MLVIALLKPVAKNRRPESDGLTLPNLLPGSSRSFRSVLVTLIAFALVGSMLSGEASARKRGSSRGRSRQSLAAAKVNKARAISVINRQLDVARGVLANAESRAAMSQSAVSSSIAKLSDVREQIDSAHDDVYQAAKTLRDLEKEIIAEQPEDSELKIALTVLQQAKNTMHDALHRVFDIPHVTGISDEAARLSEYESLSDEQKEVLKQDSAYQVAQRDMQSAAAQVTRLRRELFLADRDWVEAREELTSADKRSREGTQQATTAGMNFFGSSQKLHSSQQLAAAARAVIAQGEARLRQLGGKSGTSTSQRKKK